MCRSPTGTGRAWGAAGLADAESTPTTDQRTELKLVLRDLAATRTTPTGLCGEAWERFGGVPKPVEDQPHVCGDNSMICLSSRNETAPKR